MPVTVLLPIYEAVNTMHTTLDRFSPRADVLTLAARAISWPTRSVRAALDGLNRRRERARLRAELTALNDRLLADIGLRRGPADHWHAVNSSCG